MKGSGDPYCSLVNIATAADGAPILLISALAVHTRARCIGVDNGIDLPSAATSRPAPAPGDRIELVYLSTLVGEKGVFTAARGTRALASRGLRVRLRCAGSWYDAREEAAFAHELHRELIDGTIELIGFVHEPAKLQLFDSAHFFVLPSTLAEGQPLALIEAMARGVVPVTTAVGAMPDVLAVADRDRLCSDRHRDPDALATTIAELAAEPDGYAAASAACLDHQRTHLTMARCATTVIDVLEGVAT